MSGAQTNSGLYYLVGASGVGKDSLLRQLKQYQYAHSQPLVAHRYITRQVREDDENHIALTGFDFNRRRASGLFLFYWETHGFEYAIGEEVRQWLASGHNVIVNGSRGYLRRAQQIYPNLIPLWMTLSNDVLEQRLIARGRENLAQIAARIKRNHELEASRPETCITICNDLSLDNTIEQLLSLLESRAP